MVVLTTTTKYIYNEIYIVLFNKCYILYKWIVFNEPLTN
jgi:hypothetical protein